MWRLYDGTKDVTAAFRADDPHDGRIWHNRSAAAALDGQLPLANADAIVARRLRRFETRAQPPPLLDAAVRTQRTQLIPERRERYVINKTATATSARMERLFSGA